MHDIPSEHHDDPEEDDVGHAHGAAYARVHESRNNTLSSFLIGIIVLAILALLFLYFVLPFLGGSRFWTPSFTILTK